MKTGEITGKNGFVKTFILLLSIFLLIPTVVFSIPNSLTLQGKLTNLAGASQQGNFNFTFRIYDAASDGSQLWASINQSVATDANGVYDAILRNINLSFADQYYLGIAVQGDNESTPRINLTSSPYSFRANVSEGLNANNSYVVTNLSITGNATIGTGGTTLVISTQGFNLTALGNIFSSGNLSIAGNTFFVNSLTGNVGIGTTSPNQLLHVNNGQIRVISSGGINGARIGSDNTGFFIGTDDSNFSMLSVWGGAGSSVLAMRITSNGDIGIGTPNSISPTTARLNIVGNTSDSSAYGLIINSSTGNPNFVVRNDGNTGINTTAPKYALQVQGGVNLSNAVYVQNNGNVGIGTTSPNEKLVVIGNVNISGNLNVSGEIYLRNSPVQIESTAFKISNGTSLPFSNFLYSNITLFLGVDNASIIRAGNRSFVLEMLGNATINRSVDLSAYNKSIDLSSYNKSVDLSLYNQSVDLSGYIKNGVQNFSSVVILGNLNISSLNDTSLSLFNKSIDLSSYNKSIDLSSYNKSISLVNYNQSIDLSSYNKSVDLSSYNKSINLITILIKDIISNDLLSRVSDAFNLANNGTGFTRSADGFNYANNLSFNGTLLNANHLISLWNFANNESVILDNNSVVRAGNLSSYTRVSDAFNKINASGLSFSNFQLSNVSNVTSWSNIINIPAFSNFQISNVSNTTSWSNIINIPAFSNFQISNVSNNTLVKGDNATTALWNVSLTTNASYIYTRDSYSVLIGASNLSNITEKLVVIGNVNVSGYINASGDIKTAGSFYQGGNVVLLSKDFNLGNISNTTSWSNIINIPAFSNFQLSNVSNTTSWSNIINIPAFSNFQLSNVSNVTSWSNIINIPAFSNFQLSNVSNDTLKISGNASISLWNASGSNIYPREISGNVGIGTTAPNYLLQTASGTEGRSVNLSNVLYVNGSSGNVGIGTTTPQNKLEVIGAVTIAGSLNATSINTTGSAYFATSGVGNVGINTTTPANTLTVLGTLNVTSQNTRSGDLFVASSGNVGIGTPNPDQVGDGVTPTVTLFATGASTRPSLELVGNSAVDTAAVGTINFLNQAAGNGKRLVDFSAVVDGASNSGAFILFTMNAGTRAERLRITKAGNVGIGTTTPGQTLHVVGNTNVSQTLNAPVLNTTRADQNITISSGGGSVIIRLG